MIIAKKEADWEVRVMLELIKTCEQYYSLPKPGGVLDQDSLFIYLNNKVTEFRNIRYEFDNRNSNKKVG